jgi:hypothetical protein
MSLRKIIDWAIEDQKSELKGNIASPFYQYQDYAGSWVWACDVDLGGGGDNVLRSVPVAANNREVIYAEQGKGVSLSRMGKGKWAITGLSKTLNSTVHMIFVSFVDDIGQISGRRLAGNIIRPLSYGEMGELIAPFGYGVLPYGLQGKFDAQGNFIEIVEWY